MRNPLTFKNEAEKECYVFIDKYYKKLVKNANGSVNHLQNDLDDNDIDALRHSYVSGIFTQEFGEKAAEIFGILNELKPGGGSSSNNFNSRNMDLWNNAVGRNYSKRTSGRKKLFKLLLQALKKGELIIDPDEDKRKYEGKVTDVNALDLKIIVIKETRKGKNVLYFDRQLSIVLSRDEFLAEIKLGKYPTYEIRLIDRNEIPVSKKDKIIPNNLG